MNQKEKEIVAIAASVASGCEYCTQYHVKEARSAGADETEIENTVRLALTVRERATMRIASVAWKELGQERAMPNCESCKPPSRIEALALAAGALAANCGSGVPFFIAQAQSAGADERDCELALALARKVKKVAAERADAETEGNCNGESACCSSATGNNNCCAG